MTRFNLFRRAPLLLLLAACADEPTTVGPEPRPEPKPAPRIVGVYEVTLTGLSGAEMRSSIAAVPSGPGQTLTPSATGLAIDLLSSNRMSHGPRGAGQRYVSFTYRVRNTTGAAFSNLTLVLIENSKTMPGTPFSSVLKTDGTAVDSATVSKIVPAGAVAITDEGNLKSIQTDVLQVFEESEIAAVTPPSGVTGIFPTGFVVRNPATPNSRTLPNAADPDDYGGATTLAFRYPFFTAPADEPNTITFQMLAVDDSETRLTESIEEGQDPAAVQQIRDRAVALGATTVTVLAGSSALDPAVPDYPGQRQICSVRTAGAAGSPITYITEPGGYVRIQVLQPGETVDPCAPYFRTGTAARPAYGVPFALTLNAMDLYGNPRTAAVDSVRLEQVSGPTVTLGPRAALVSGSATINATYFAYGASLLRAAGRRNRGAQSLNVAGITRVWSGNVSTDPGNPNNWEIGYYTGPQDTAYFPAGRPHYVVMVANASIGGVILEDGATMDMGPYDLTASHNVWTGTTGGITSTTGRLVLTGLNKTVRGNLPRMQVTGTYTLSAAVTSRASVELAGGRLRTTGFRLRTTSY